MNESLLYRLPGTPSSRDPGPDFDLDPNLYNKPQNLVDPGSRPESQRVASCANRLVVTPGAYRGDAGMDPGISKRIRNGSSTMDYLIIFLTENGALPTTAYRDDEEEAIGI